MQITEFAAMDVIFNATSVSFDMVYELNKNIYSTP